MRLAVSAAGFAAAFCLSNLSFATPPTTYRLTEIGAQDPPEQTTQLSTINILGETVVTVSVNGTAHAYVWRAGQQVPINIPDSVCGAGARVYGTGINNLEQVSATVVGTTPSGGLCYKTVIWHNGKVIAILNPPANVTSLPGGLLNDFRQVIGTAYTVDGGEPPFVWRNGHTTILPVLPGAAPSGPGGANAYFINDLGAIAGTSGSTDSPHAVVWRNGNITDLGVCPDLESSAATGINNLGEVVGNCHTYDYTPVLWRAGQMTVLPLSFCCATSAIAYRINDFGQITGTLYAPPNTPRQLGAALLWQGGKVYDLNTLIAADDPSKPWIQLLEADEISDTGFITARGIDGRYSNQNIWFVLTPAR